MSPVCPFDSEGHDIFRTVIYNLFALSIGQLFQLELVNWKLDMKKKRKKYTKKYEGKIHEHEVISSKSKPHSQNRRDSHAYARTLAQLVLR